MYIYLLSQTVNNNYGTYDSCVVVASNVEEARHMHPRGDDEWGDEYDTWAPRPEDVAVTYVGLASCRYTEPCFICKSFNAG